MAQIVRMPDGTKVSFPDDMPKEEIRALIEEKFPDAAASAPKKLKGKVSELPSRQKTLASEAIDYTSQALSGVNEGIAMLAGAPVDLMSMGMNAGIDMANANLGTEIPNITTPVGGSKMFADFMGPAISPESEEAPKKFVRRIGQEVGSALIPGLGLASRAAKPLEVVGNTLKAAVGSGTGAATANVVAPDNPYAEMAGQLIGGGATGLIRKGAGAMKAPTSEELQALKREAYKAVDNLGAKYTPQAYSDLTKAVDNAVAAKNISPTRHPKAYSFVQDMRTRFKQGMSLTELDQLRQEVRRDLLRSSDEAEQFFGNVIIDEIDDFVAKAGAGQMAAGSGPDAAKAINAARELNTRWRKTELIEDALYAADLKTASTGSGGNLNNAIRQAFRSILTSEKKRRAFTADEISEMERVVKQGKGEELLRLVGKLSPGGNGLMAALGIGGTVANPLLAAVPLTGIAAKTIADSGTVRKAALLRAKVASGQGNTLKMPNPDNELATAAVLTGGSAANDNTRKAVLRMEALN